MCSRDQAYWLTRRRLVFDIYVEEYTVHQVMRQFGLFQAAPVVDAKSAPSVKHTASRKAGFARAKSRDDVPVNFS
jgi:hypothetical protein